MICPVEAAVFVSESSPDANYSGDPLLRASTNDPATGTTVTFIRFTIAGLPQAPWHIWVRLWVVDGSTQTSGGGIAYEYTNNWDPKTLTWNNSGAATVTSLPEVRNSLRGPQAPGQWMTMAVSNSVAGNGTWSIAIASPASDGIAWASTHDPQGRYPTIVIDPGLGPPATAVP